MAKRKAGIIEDPPGRHSTSLRPGQPGAQYVWIPHQVRNDRDGIAALGGVTPPTGGGAKHF